MTGLEISGGSGEVGRRSRPKPPKGEETVVEIGKEYIRDRTLRWCR